VYFIISIDSKKNDIHKVVISVCLSDFIFVCQIITLESPLTDLPQMLTEESGTLLNHRNVLSLI